MERLIAIGGCVALCVAGLGLMRSTAARPPQDVSPLPRPVAAPAVTLFVQTAVASRVLTDEDALLAAQRRVEEYRGSRMDGGTLAAALNREALVLIVASAAPVSLPPSLDSHVTQDMTCLVEDVALFGEQAAALLQETAAALLAITTQEASGATVSGDAVTSTGYAPRVRGALSLLRRAEGWLEMLDHDTGAHATLPGFAPGAPSLEGQFAMQ
jgi:hypothetical protein